MYYGYKIFNEKQPQIFIWPYMYIYCVIVCVFLIDSFDYSQTCSGIKYLICDFFCCDLSILKRGTTKGKVNYSSAQFRGTYIHTYAHRYSEIAIK